MAGNSTLTGQSLMGECCSHGCCLLLQMVEARERRIEALKSQNKVTCPTAPKTDSLSPSKQNCERTQRVLIHVPISLRGLINHAHRHSYIKFTRGTRNVTVLHLHSRRPYSAGWEALATDLSLFLGCSCRVCQVSGANEISAPQTDTSCSQPSVMLKFSANPKL